MSQVRGILDILKIMIFANKIENELKMIECFWSLLPEFMHKKRNQII